MISYLEFEKPVAELEQRIAELRSAADGDDVDISTELHRLEQKSADLLASTYESLSPWQKTQVARHPSRPHFRDYVEQAFEDFVPLGGDRNYGDDEAILGGFAKLNGRKIILIGHEKGNDTASRIRHNFGMGKPEGYRKAIRLMEMAGRFGLPVVTLVDTSGALTIVLVWYPIGVAKLAEAPNMTTRSRARVSTPTLFARSMTMGVMMAATALLVTTSVRNEGSA